MKNIKLYEFDSVEEANAWLEKNKELEIIDIKYAASVTQTKELTKVLIILSVK